MLQRWLSIVDWFIPDAYALEKSDLGFLRSFVFLHMVGPLLGQSIAAFLYVADPNRGLVFWIIELTICSFWLFPLVLKYTGSLFAAALGSVQTLIFVSLFGSFFYGGVSSPFQPWLLIALLLGFFYLSDRPKLVLVGLVAQIAIFIAAYGLNGSFPHRIPLENLAEVNLISVFSATVYMSLMAIYYATVITERSDLEREAERHRETAIRLQEALEHAKEANRDKSVFLAKMSHELRTPLNAVIGYSEMLLEDAASSGTETNSQKMTDLSRISAAGKHLLGLVTDVLDLSRIEADMIDINSARFDLDHFIDELVGGALPLMNNQNNRFELQRPARLGSMVADEQKLRQSLLNLLSNAAKFTSNGVITLTVMRMRSAVGDSILFEVRDTGIGIAEADLNKLFQNFAQATADTSKKYGGTGLGLVVTKRFCTLMGGSVKVESERGQGSSFTITLPAEGIDAMASELGAQPARPHMLVA
jgi:signal transduction histidine kinase